MMTGDNIKNDCNDHSKGKHDRRNIGPKRRSSRNSQVCESGADATLSVASQENTRLLKQPDLGRICGVNVLKCGENTAPEVKTVCEEPKLAKEDSQETRHLKELLLLHLELTQHQHELLAAKDEQLQVVKKERDALKCRLMRMERRMSLLKQKKEPESLQLETDSPPCSPARHGRHNAENRGQKRRHTFEPQRLSKRFAPASRTSSPHKHRSAITPTHRQLSRPDPPRVRETRIPTPAYLDPKNIPKRPCDRYFESPEACSKPVNVVDTQKLLKLAQKRSLFVSENIHRTSMMYYIPPVTADVCELSPPKEHKKDGVAVPTWRIKQIPKAYTLEGTENLGDDIYIKRHQKLENDEKRRKRWDIQQLREQKMVEKLRQTQLLPQTKTTESAAEAQSLLPTLDDIKYLEVCDSIPVSAFGDAVPYLKSDTFDLPWFNPEKRRKEERTKSRCRKR